MTFDFFYDTLRLILGDEQVHGIWNYSDEKLDTAVKSVFMLGRAPTSYALDQDTDIITPDVKQGDDYALVCYEAVLLTVGGEDGAMRIQTRELSISDEGHRKRDLLAELKELVHQIRNGAAIFSTWQDFDSFVHSLRPGWPLTMADTSVVTTPPDVMI